MTTVLAILLFMMIVSAIIAIETENLLSAIICVGAVGFLVAIAFLFLGAPDIAITQLIVDILCLVILIRATISRDLTSVGGDREFLGLVTTIGLVLVVALTAILVFADFPQFGSSVIDRFGDAPAATYLSEGLEKTGAANAVTGVLLDFRAYDTLGEATVLFCAIMGAVAVLRKKARKKADEDEER